MFVNRRLLRGISGLIALILSLGAGSGLTGSQNGLASALEPGYFFLSPDETGPDVVIADSIAVSAAGLTGAEGQGISIVSAPDSMSFGQKVIRMEPEASLTFEVPVAVAGGYHLEIDYLIPDESLQELFLGVQVNGVYPFYESRNIKLPTIWQDETKAYRQDVYGNDVYPSSSRIFRWQKTILNNLVYNQSKPLVFQMAAGSNTLTLSNNQVPILIGRVTLLGAQSILDYQSYKTMHAAETVITDYLQTTQAEQYVEKSAYYVRSGKSNSVHFQPYEAGRYRISLLDGYSSSQPGESVSWALDIPSTGLYRLAVKYRQDQKADFPAFKRILINGEVPFREFLAYPFAYTSSDIRNEVLSVQGEPVAIYLEAGRQILTLESTADPYYATYQNLQTIIDRNAELALQVQYITGNKVDKNREWNILDYVPELVTQLDESSRILRREYQRLSALIGKSNAPNLSDLRIAADRLDEFAADPDELVNNISQLSQGSSSISQQIAIILPELLRQPVDIDCLYVAGAQTVIPPARAGFFRSLTEEFKKLALSFTQSHDRGQTKQPGMLNVWVNRSIPHLEVLREMTDTLFTQKTGIKVNLSVMNDEQKLLLANSAGQAPDVVLGASSYRPFDFALRGAIYDLRRFDDFDQFIQDFPSESFIPFIVDEGCYGIPETVNFQVLFYRKDILEQLNLTVPDTWEDVIDMLPVLTRYGMNFNTLIASVGSFKHFGATVPFIQQYEGRIYSEDGASIELGDARTVEAFRLMTDLYTRYSLPETIANFFDNFRNGMTPIGMSDFNTYNLLKNAAPEISEQWGIAPSIGVRALDGEILRYQPSVSTACLIMASAEQPDDGWELIKWWMTSDIQTRYATELQLRFGPEYIWNTASLAAFANSTAYTEADKAVILEQFAHMKEIPRNPAYFAVERSLSNAWNKVVFNGVSPRTALDQAIVESNRIIRRKLKEFGYIDSQDILVKPFRMATADMVDAWKEGN